MTVDGDQYLADVGFGVGSFDEPIRCEPFTAQADSAGVFSLRPAGSDDFDLVRADAFQYA